MKFDGTLAPILYDNVTHLNLFSKLEQANPFKVGMANMQWHGIMFQNHIAMGLDRASRILAEYSL